MRVINASIFLLFCGAAFGQTDPAESIDSLKISFMQSWGDFGVIHELFEMNIAGDSGYIKHIITPTNRRCYEYRILDSAECRKITREFNAFDVFSMDTSQPVDSNYLFTTATGSGSMEISFNEHKNRYLKEIGYVYPISGTPDFLFFYRWLLGSYSLDPFSVLVYYPDGSSDISVPELYDFDFKTLVRLYDNPAQVIYTNKKFRKGNWFFQKVITEAISDIKDSSQIGPMVDYLQNESKTEIKKAILNNFTFSLSNNNITRAIGELIEREAGAKEELAVELINALNNQPAGRLKINALKKGLTFTNPDAKLNAAIYLSENGYGDGKEIILKYLNDNKVNTDRAICALLKVKDKALLAELYEIYSHLDQYQESDYAARYHKGYLILGMDEIITSDTNISCKDCEHFWRYESSYMLDTTQDLKEKERLINNYMKKK